MNMGGEAGAGQFRSGPTAMMLAWARLAVIQ
jgi:hypothetical protein